MSRAYTQLLACFLIFGFITISHAATPNIDDSTAVETFFDIAFEVQKLDHELVGSTVVVVKDGRILFKKGYGFADLENRVPVDPDRHLFRIASVSKPFTWTAVMQLVEMGELDLEVDIQKYLDFPIPKTFDQPIMLKHLMTHSAGFEDLSVAGFASTPEDVVPLAVYLPTHIPLRVRQPGTYISYSNYGSALAGYIVERVSGIPWANYIQENILDPLKMDATNVHQPMLETHWNNHAKGYKYSNGKFKATDFWFEQEAPAGIISATAADMANFMLFQLNQGQFKNQSILKPETIRKMQSGLFQQHPQATPTLHGFYRTDRNGLEIFGHGGDVNQFHSILSFVPEHNLGVFVSYNSDPASRARANVILAFFDYFFPADFPETRAPNDVIDLEDYTGNWTSTRRNHSTFEKMSLLVSQQIISTDEEELILSSDRSTSRWIPVEKDYFRAKYSNRVLLFYRDEMGNVSHFSSNIGIGSAEKVPWFEQQSLHLFLFGLIISIALIYLTRFIYRLFFDRSTAIDFTQWIAAINASMMLFLIYRIVAALTGSTDAFLFDVPASMELTLAMALAYVVLAILASILNIRAWFRQAGTVLYRMNHSLLIFATWLFVLQLWFWNVLGYYL